MGSLSLLGLGVGGLLAIAALGARAAPGDPAVQLDGGCLVYLDGLPSYGTGCHIHYIEPNQDGGETESIAAVACDQQIKVCGEPVRCRCPER